MEEARRSYRTHILAIPYPSQGHVNPMLQFCKRLVSRGAKATLAITNFISTTMKPKSDTVSITTISDGFDDGGFMQAESVADYLIRMEIAGTKTLEELLKTSQSSNNPFDCLIYDPFLPWALEVAKKFGIKGASFFTQACAVNYVYYYAHHGLLKLPVSAPPPVEIPGLPPLDLVDMPSFIYVHGSYPAYFEMVLNQFSNLDKADFVLVNTYYELEQKVVDSMNKVCPILTIGPTLPSFYLDNLVENDNEYGIHLFHLDPSTCLSWLNTKSKGSVVYIAFGSMANLPETQMEEIAWGLKKINFNFLWVVRDSEKEKLPKSFVQEMTKCGKGMIVNWSSQLKVLTNEAMGCFLSHGGWNSTIEALSLGVPMVVLPQWTDQTMNAKLVQDVWGVGVRARVDDKGIVGREEIETCVREILEGEKGKEMKMNAIKWKRLAKEAVSEGGSSSRNIEMLFSKLKFGVEPGVDAFPES